MQLIKGSNIIIHLGGTSKLFEKLKAGVFCYCLEFLNSFWVAVSGTRNQVAGLSPPLGARNFT